VRLAIVLVLAVSLLATPVPVKADGDSDGVPDWIPLTVAGVMALGGLLYLHRQISDDDPVSRKTPRQSALDLIAYVSTPEERAELEALESKEEVQGFLNRFFSARDPLPETPENEFRDELVRRFRYANANLGDQNEGWKGDAGRVYILYGPPETVLRAHLLEEQSAPRLQWKYAEFWEYSRGAGGNPVPDLFRDSTLFDETFHVPLPSSGRMLFVFARKTEGGRLVQVYSTEPGEPMDPAILGTNAGGIR
jgi:GWxTD domain-containing protein